MALVLIASQYSRPTDRSAKQVLTRCCRAFCRHSCMQEEGYTVHESYRRSHNALEMLKVRLEGTSVRCFVLNTVLMPSRPVFPAPQDGDYEPGAEQVQERTAGTLC